MLFVIKDYEIVKKVRVEAPGMLEAMLEYLPWPTLQIDFDYQPTNGTARVIDKKTDFMYDITIVG